MRVIKLLFKDTKKIITTSIEEIATSCERNPTEFEILRALKEMERDNEIMIISFSKYN